MSEMWDMKNVGYGQLYNLDCRKLQLTNENKAFQRAE